MGGKHPGTCFLSSVGRCDELAVSISRSEVFVDKHMDHDRVIHGTRCSENTSAAAVFAWKRGRVI